MQALRVSSLLVTSNLEQRSIGIYSAVDVVLYVVCADDFQEGVPSMTKQRTSKINLMVSRYTG